MIHFPSLLRSREALLVLDVRCLFVASDWSSAPVRHDWKRRLLREQQATDGHPVTSATKISDLAHRVMLAGMKANALAGDDSTPWHMKMDFQVIPLGAKKPVSGTMEEWHLSRDKWARTFKSPEQRLTGSEWSVSATEQLLSKPSKVGLDHRLLVLRVARPVLDPLYQIRQCAVGLRDGREAGQHGRCVAELCFGNRSAALCGTGQSGLAVPDDVL